MRAGLRARIPSSPGRDGALAPRIPFSIQTSYVLRTMTTTIPMRRVAGTSVAVSELSLGCSQLGNMYREVSDTDARSTVDAAWELGVRYFDTAPHYGLGLSERRLGSALASHPRDAYV